MPDVDFASYTYYPALQCSFAEHLGYRQLSEDDKNKLLPIFELSQQTYEDKDFAGPLDQVKTSANGAPFILDLCKDPCPPPFVSSSKKTDRLRRG